MIHGDILTEPVGKFYLLLFTFNFQFSSNQSFIFIFKDIHFPPCHTRCLLCLAHLYRRW